MKGELNGEKEAEEQGGSTYSKRGCEEERI